MDKDDCENKEQNIVEWKENWKVLFSSFWGVESQKLLQRRSCKTFLLYYNHKMKTIKKMIFLFTWYTNIKFHTMLFKLTAAKKISCMSKIFISKIVSMLKSLFVI